MPKLPTAVLESIEEAGHSTGTEQYGSRYGQPLLIAPRTEPYVRVYAYGSHLGWVATKRSMG